MVCSVVNLRPRFGHDKADDETGFRQSGHGVNFGARSDRSSGVVGPKIQSRTSFAFISFLSFLSDTSAASRRACPTDALQNL